MAEYSIAADANTMAFAAWNPDTQSHHLWIASLDGRQPPRPVAAALKGERPAFAPNGDLFFVSTEGSSRFLERLSKDGINRSRVVPDAILAFLNVAPDGEWVIVRVATPDGFNAVKLYPVRGGPPVALCDFCQAGWTAEGDVFWMSLGGMVAAGGGQTYAVPLKDGRVIPPLPASGIRSLDDLRAIEGIRLLRDGPALVGPQESLYAYSREVVQRNLYRVRVP